MASSFGGTIKLQGESEYRKALKDITTNLKLVSSELKLTNTEFSTGDKTLRQAKSSYENMNKTMQDQKAKVNELRETLSKMEKEYGSNNEKVKMFKTQLNNAENQLKQMEDATDKSNKELKEMKKGFDDAGGGALKFGDILKANVLGDVIVGGLKKLGSAVLEVGKAFLDVGKQALDGYAEFEQLEGGVKKLFGDDMASSVISNANNAFKTAGMSANEYLDTVTGFSASLITSLGGDTEKATSYADRAIQDMSDNANTFGTDMESIQHAYQGFAKGQFNMLDNLKLGYGGTKTEMERLLADAEKISGVKYDISSFADITEAIHIMQEEMHIAGTTSKEAGTTIEGSVNSMKSAWQNLLTGLAGDGENLSQLIDNLMQSIFGDGSDTNLGVLGNVLPVIERIIDSFGNMIPLIVAKITEHLPELIKSGVSLIQNLINGIQENMPQVIQATIQIINTLVTTLIQMAPQILQMGITLLLELVKGIAQTLPTLIPTMVEAIMTMVNTLLDNIDEIIETGIQLLVALTEGIMNALPELISRLPEIIIKIVTKLIELSPQLLSAALRIILALAEGLIKYIPEMVSRVPQIIKSIVNALKEGVKDFVDIGANLLKGLWQGISNTKDWLIEKVKGIGKSVTGAIKGIFGIKSPSKVFKDEIGTNLALGLGEGFEDTMSDVKRDMADAIPTEFDTNVSMNTKSGTSSMSSYDTMVSAFKKALSDVKVVMNDREMGTFVTDTMEKVVYS